MSKSDHITELTPLRPTIGVEPTPQPPKATCCTYLRGILSAYSFLFLVATAILLAYVYPPLGATYLHPSITANWVAVLFIFLMAGLSMKTEELQRAFVSFPFNAFVQTYNFLAVSGLAYGYIHLVNTFGNEPLMQPDMANAMMICASMPITVTMVIVMVKSADGDSASAVFNAALGSLLGVFVSPGLILAYTGISGSVDLASVFLKLSLKVVLPIAIGQILFGGKPRLCITGLYACHEKSVVVGIPLINAMFEHSPNVGLYTLPLLVWHPLQLIVGSALAPRLAMTVEAAIKGGEITDIQRRDNELRASQEALVRVSLVAWDDSTDVHELLDEEQRII